MQTITLYHKTNPDIKLVINTKRPDLIEDIIKGVSNSFEDYNIVKPKKVKSNKQEEITRLSHV